MSSIRQKFRLLTSLGLACFSGWILGGSTPHGSRQAAAQDPGSARPVAGIADRLPELYALQDARIVAAPGQMLARGTVLISGQTITAVGADVQLPPGTQPISLRGKTIYAGLIDLGGEASGSETAPTPVRGSGHWNPYVTPANSPVIRVGQDEPIADAAALRGQGVTVRVLAPSGGIFSGSSHAVLTGGPSSLAPTLRQHVAQHLQLTVPRGAGHNTFPKSPMGAVALVRQTMIDSSWYQQALQAHQNNPRLPAPEVDQALQQIGAAMQSGTFIVDCPNERFIGRADALAREFSIAVVLKGSGREYQLLDQVAGTGRTLLIPVAFPKPPEVATAQDASEVSLTELMHWQLAPENPAKLSAAGVRFALTTAELPKPADFLAAVRQAVRRGLPADVALAALTTVPAEVLGLDSRIGTIAPGKLANLIVVDGDLFADDAPLLETWVAGRRYRHQPEPWHSEGIEQLDGRWTLRLSGAELPLEQLELTLSHPASKSDAKPKPAEILKLEGKLAPAGATQDGQDAEKTPTTSLARVTPQRDRLTATFDADELDPKLPSGVARLTLLISRNSPQATPAADEPAIKLSGEIVWPDGNVSRVTAEPIASNDEAGDKPNDKQDDAAAEDDKTEDSEDGKTEDAALPPLDCPVNRPLGAYGVAALPPQPEAVLFRGATLWTCGPEGVLENADLLVRKGKIVQIGRDLAQPENCQVVDAAGLHLTPGLIDCHSHIATDGGINEASRAVTADVRIGDFIDHTDITIYRQLAGGVTTANILHGSANPIGGQNQVIKLRWGAGPEDLRFDTAPPGIKFALGENVKRSSWRDDDSARYPQSRMGVEQLLRDQFLAAREYDQAWRDWNAGRRNDRLPPRRDLRLEAIAEVLRGERWVHCHSYRQDEIAALLTVFQEFNVQIGTLQHVLEGYKVAEVLAEHQAMASTFADWWAYKIEAYDAIPYNAAILEQRGVVVSMNSDDRELGRHLNTEAGKAVKYGGVSETQALNMVTLNPAKQLRIDQWVGSLEAGKDADLVLWSGPPLSTLSRCEQTWIEGRQYFSRSGDAQQRTENEQLRARLIQQVLAKPSKKAAGEKSGAKPSDQPSLAMVAEEARWPREDLYCAARRGRIATDADGAAEQPQGVAAPAQP